QRRFNVEKDALLRFLLQPRFENPAQLPREVGCLDAMFGVTRGLFVLQIEFGLTGRRGARRGRRVSEKRLRKETERMAQGRFNERMRQHDIEELAANGDTVP